MISKFSERIITVDRKDHTILYTGSTERDTAHQKGIRHLTVIVVPFLKDGADKGKWIVHNRRDKQLAKGLLTPAYSYNLFGGHCNPPVKEDKFIGKEIGKELLLDAALREMNEEFYLKSNSGVALKSFGSDKVIFAQPYPLSPDDLIPLGCADFDDGCDAECSFFYALPISSADAQNIIAADDYIRKDGKKENIALPAAILSERKLYSLYHKNNSNTEICNAITRLWEEQNQSLYQKLLDTIKSL